MKRIREGEKKAHLLKLLLPSHLPPELLSFQQRCVKAPAGGVHHFPFSLRSTVCVWRGGCQLNWFPRARLLKLQLVCLLLHLSAKLRRRRARPGPLPKPLLWLVWESCSKSTKAPGTLRNIPPRDVSGLIQRLYSSLCSISGGLWIDRAV